MSEHLKRNQPAGMNIHWLFYSLDDFLDSQQHIGFESIELWGGMPHVELDRLSYFDAKEIRYKIEKRGMKVHVFTPENCTYPYQFAAKGERYVQHTYDYFTNGLRMASELGCDVMAVNSGWGYWNENREEAWKRSREMLHRLAEFGETVGVTLAMETLRPQESQLVINIADARRMYDEVGHPNLKLMIDTCAMAVSGETIAQWFEEFGVENIRDIHFIDGTPYGHLIWGDGNRDMTAYVHDLNTYGYEGYLGQEITDFKYFNNPGEADKKNFAAFQKFFVDD